MSESLYLGGALDTPYAERSPRKSTGLDEWAERMTAPISRRRASSTAPSDRLVEGVLALETKTTEWSDQAIADELATLREALRRDGLEDALVTRSFALVRELAWRRLGMRHHPVQLLGGHLLLRGLVAEMQTGEGKTLTATLPAAVAALAGWPVHVISVNDYLVARDAEEMSPLYEAMGLRVGAIQEGMSPNERRAQYACDVTYVSNKEVAFDYLKDRITLGGDRSRTRLILERIASGRSRADDLILRGLTFGIVDEADSVLIDEARTPLIITASDEGDELEDEIFEAAIELAQELVPGEHFDVSLHDRRVQMREAAEAELEHACLGMDAFWQGRRRRSQLVLQALTALHAYHPDHDYLVRDGRIQIIDGNTGRVMSDRSWEQGLHQMIEAKEGCEITGQNRPLARLSYQRFFSRYRRLAGMTGTAEEVAGELWSVYGLATVRVPPNRLSRREDLGEQIFARSDERWQALAARTAEIHAQERPVLIGTRSVAASHAVSEALAARGLPHRVLNAQQDDEEAQIVAEAGEPGRITVATNMAGRGTDIKLAPEVAARGGLHVILAERNEARRIDRQLFGRCGRQGDPGSHESLISLEDDLVVNHAPRAAALARDRATLLGPAATTLAQRRSERIHARARRSVMKSDAAGESLLAFAGKGE